MYRIKQHKYNKIAILAKQNKSIFHTQDLMILWQIFNKNTLYTTIKRYCQQGLLFRIQKGMYSIIPINQLHPWLLGSHALHSYSYVSTETILAEAGAINQVIEPTTLISSKSSKFKLGKNYFLTRQLNDKYLFNNAGIITKDNINLATLERAAADMIYYNPKFHFDNRKLINWNQVKKLQKQIYDFT